MTAQPDLLARIAHTRSLWQSARASGPPDWAAALRARLSYLLAELGYERQCRRSRPARSA